MRLYRGVSMLCSVAAVAAASAPAASAFDNRAPALGGPDDARAVLVQQHPTGAVEWVVIGIGAAGGIALAGVGAAGIRRSARRPTGTVGAAGR
jgi:amino acid transporter